MTSSPGDVIVLADQSAARVASRLNVLSVCRAEADSQAVARIHWHQGHIQLITAWPSHVCIITLSDKHTLSHNFCRRMICGDMSFTVFVGHVCLSRS